MYCYLKGMRRCYHDMDDCCMPKYHHKKCCGCGWKKHYDSCCCHKRRYCCDYDKDDMCKKSYSDCMYDFKMECREDEEEE